MNGYKLRAVLDHVRSQGRLPRDQWDNTLDPDDILAWFGLHDLLSPAERDLVADELRAMAEAEAFADQLRRRGS